MIKLDMKFISLNEYINAERTNRFMASSIKKKMTNDVLKQLTMIKVETPCNIHFHWRISGRKDLDNECFAKKYILDALVKKGILPNDNINYITGFIDTFEKTKDLGVDITFLKGGLNV